MKNTKLGLTIIATTLMLGSFAVNAATGDNNSDENVQNTKSYQTFIQAHTQSGEVSADNSVFQNHDSNH